MTKNKNESCFGVAFKHIRNFANEINANNSITIDDLETARYLIEVAAQSLEGNPLKMNAQARKYWGVK